MLAYALGKNLPYSVWEDSVEEMGLAAQPWPLPEKHRQLNSSAKPWLSCQNHFPGCGRAIVFPAEADVPAEISGLSA